MYSQRTIQKLKRIQETVEATHGEKFRLFAAAQRHHASTWDLPISASWLDDDMLPGLRELSGLLSKINMTDLTSFGSMIVLDHRSPVYQDIVEESRRNPPGVTLHNRVLGNIEYDQLDILRVSGEAVMARP